MTIIKDWHSLYPISLDNTTDSSMPDLTNDEVFMRVSQIMSIRDSLIELETAVGSDLKETGTLRYNLEHITFDQLYNNQSGIRIINVDDQPISFSGNQEIRFDGGPIRLTEQGSDPSYLDNYGFIYAKDISYYSELFYLDNYNNSIQLTNQGKHTDQNAIHVDVAGEIAAITSVIPVGSDYLLIEDVDDSNNKKSINISDIIPPSTKGDIFTYNTTYARLPVGVNDYILSVDVSEPTGLKWVVNTAGLDPNAIHKGLAAEISGITSATPTGSDYLLIEDADDSNNKKHILINDIIPVGTKGDIFTYSTTWDNLSIGPDGYLLSVDSSESTGLKWIENVSNTDPNAIHKNVAGEIAAITSTVPTGSDYLLIEDADDLNNKKKINVSDIVPLTTKGDLFVFSSTIDRLPLGNNGQILSVDSSESTGLKWVDSVVSDNVLTDGYLYLKSQSTDPIERDNYGALYIKTDDGYSELYYMDNDGYVSQITQKGLICSYNGHGEDTPPITPSTYDETWLTNSLDSKWSWTTYGAGVPSGNSYYTITNNHMVVKAYQTNLGTYLPGTYAHCLLQSFSASGTIIAYGKFDCIKISAGAGVPHCGIIMLDSLLTSGTIVAGWESRYISYYANGGSWTQEFDISVEGMPLLGFKYNSSSGAIDYFVAFDYDDDIENMGSILDSSVLGWTPAYIGLIFYNRDLAGTCLFRCDWFRTTNI